MKRLSIAALITMIILIAGLSFLFALYNPTKNKELDKELYGISYYPDGFMVDQTVRFQDRVQQHIVSQNGIEKIIFETIVKKTDSVNLVDYTEVLIHEMKGVYYTYGLDGSIQYPAYNENLITKLETPNEGDYILEWSNKKYDFRIFGTIEMNELILIAESIPQ